MQLRQEPKLNKVLNKVLEHKSKYLPEFGTIRGWDEAAPRLDYYYRLLPVLFTHQFILKAGHSPQK